jgi:hypothetical protein
MSRQGLGRVKTFCRQTRSFDDVASMSGLPPVGAWDGLDHAIGQEANCTGSRELGLDRTGSPLVRRSADELFERPAKCGFGFVADFVGGG